jgi:hypothetical protein
MSYVIKKIIFVLIVCCRDHKSISPPKSAETTAGYWGSIADCDIPERTFD